MYNLNVTPFLFGGWGDLVLGIKPRALHMLGRHSTTDLNKPVISQLSWKKVGMKYNVNGQ